MIDSTSKLGRRRANRYDLQTPVCLWWRGAGGAVQSCMGVTCNISSFGVLVLASESPRVGQLIQMTIALPKRNGASHRLELHGEGVALRVEDDQRLLSGKQLVGFAASVQFYPEQVQHDFAETREDSGLQSSKWCRETEHIPYASTENRCAE